MPSGDIVSMRIGEFFGRRQSRRSAGAFALAELVPTVPERDVHEHAHSDAHFVLLCDGHYVSSAAGAPELAIAPMLVYNPPGTAHRDRFRGDGGRFFTISCHADVVRDADADGDCRLPSAARVLGGDALTLAQRLRRDVRVWDAASPVLIESLALHLLACAAAPSAARDASPAWLQQARDMLDDRWCDDIGVTDVAMSVGVHPVHLARRFRERFGVAPADYLRSTRIARAADLLRRSTLPIGEIGLRCGLGDASQFSKTFLRVRGVPPRAFRRSAC